MAIFALPPPDHELVTIGTLHVATGRIVACDPFAGAGAMAFSERIAPGDFPVRLHRVGCGEMGVRVASAWLMIQPGATIVTLEAAALEHNGPVGYFVDSGLGAFMDAAARAELVKVIDAFYQAHPDGNYYTDMLAPGFACNASAPGAIGDWLMHRIPGTAHNMALFTSGLGDGAYSSYWGRDSHGEIVALVTDFGVRQQVTGRSPGPAYP